MTFSLPKVVEREDAPQSRKRAKLAEFADPSQCSKLQEARGMGQQLTPSRERLQMKLSSYPIALKLKDVFLAESQGTCSSLQYGAVISPDSGAFPSMSS